MITFEPKEIPVFPSYRPMFRIAQILLILKINCIGGKASLLKLHLFSWGLNQNKNLEVLKEFVTTNFQSELHYFGIEPSLNRALNYAIAENLIGFDGTKYFVETKGENFFAQLSKDSELFHHEKNVLKIIGKKISESKVVQLKKRWESNA